MSEVTYFRLTKIGDFDGTTASVLTRESFTVTNNRFYTAAIPETVAMGVINSDVFGFFSPDSPKIVGFASNENNPRTMVRVLDGANRVRQEINLRTDFQYVVVQAQDKIAVLSRNVQLVGVPTVALTLAINELSERDAMGWGLAHPPSFIHTHFRITRTGTNFAVNPGNQFWEPAWVWNPSSQMLEVADNDSDGPIPLNSLGLFPRTYGALVSIRYAGSDGDGKLIVVENTTKITWEAEVDLVDVQWSKVQYLSHEDLLGLSASTAVGGVLVAEIEVVRVEPGDRLRGRFAAGG